MAKIIWTDEAITWLNDIYNYIAVDNPSAASRTVESIYNKVQVLIDYPEIGYKYTDIKNRNIRVILFGHYRIAYLIKDNDEIDILGIFHGSLDIDRYLF